MATKSELIALLVKAKVLLQRVHDIDPWLINADELIKEIDDVTSEPDQRSAEKSDRA